MTATLANGWQVTIGEKGCTCVSEALTAIWAAGGIEDWTWATLKGMYEGKNTFPQNNAIAGFRMNVTGYQITDGLEVRSRKKRSAA